MIGGISLSPIGAKFSFSWPVPAALGTMFNHTFSGSSLAANNLTKYGTTSVWTTTGNNILSVNSADSNAFNDYIVTNDYDTGLEDYTNYSEATANAIGTTGNGIAIGIKGNPMTSVGRDLRCRMDFRTTNLGRMYIYEGDTLHATSAGLLTIATGDRVRLSYTRVKNVVTFTGTNLRTSATNSVSFTYNVNAQFPHATGKFCIWHLGGNFSIHNITQTTTQNKNIKVCGIGDSITYGCAATNSNDRWFTKLGLAASNSCVNAGGGDIVQRSLDKLVELKKLNAQYYLLMTGGNDVFFGTPEATWKANYQTLVTALKASDATYGKSSATVIHLKATPRDATDLRAFNTWLDTTFPGDKRIDTFTPLKGTGLYDLAAAYDFDGVHPNPAGHTLIADTIKADAPEIL